MKLEYLNNVLLQQLELIEKCPYLWQKKKHFSILCFLLTFVFVLSTTEFSFGETAGNKPLYGISYSPLRQNQSPDSQVHPSINDIENDIKYLSSITERLRIYDISGNNQFIPLIAEKYEIKLAVGLSLSKSEQKNLKNIDTLVNMANRYDNTIETIIVGNDILAKKIMDESKLIDYVRLVKSKLNSDKIKISIAESWDIWNKHPSLISEVDCVIIHIYPYYDLLNINVSAFYVIGLHDRFQHMLDQYEKEVIIGETGWPSDGKILGGAVASPENQRKFVENFMTHANSKEIKYYIFEAFDEKWKDIVLNSEAEKNFGLFYENGTMKKSLIGAIPEPLYETTRKLINNSSELDDTTWLSNYLEENSPSYSSWISNLTKWWKDKSITNTEFLNAVYYLIKSDIIEI